MCPSQEEGEEGVWQREDARCAVVLHEVFHWLSAREMCAASGACSAWRRAAAAPALWRRLLQLDARLPVREVRALARHHVCWREEYVRTFAGWEESGRVRCGGSAAHAALDPAAGGSGSGSGSAGGGRLALLTDDDVALTIWRYSSPPCRDWTPTWRCELRAQGWAGAARVQWAGSRLLLTGPLALVHAWELIVIQLDEADEGRVSSRARCSAGAGGCWADAAGDAFLSLELALLAPAVACTTVWLNSAEQETQSEHAGVRAPLFRLYNESGEHFTQAIVVECPVHDAAAAPGTLLDTSMDHDFYFNAIKQRVEDDEEVRMRVLVTTSGCGRAGGGTASAWGLTAARPGAVRAAEHGDLRARAARAAAAALPTAAPALPTEHEVRALCTAPDAVCALPAAPVGVAPHPTARCLWLALASGEPWCVSLPALRPLRRLRPPASTPLSSDLHLANHYLYYVQPSGSDCFFACPVPARGGAGVRVWSAVSGGAAPVHRLPALSAPPLQALLLPADGAGAGTLLVLAADTIHSARGTFPGNLCAEESGDKCGAGQDRVARRLAAAAAARRADYEREASCEPANAAPPPDATPAAPLSAGGARHCARATDGRTYSLPCAPDPLPPCGPCREPAPPRTLDLQPDDHCRVTGRRYVDPCAHRPRTFVEIARGKSEAAAPASAPPSRGLASRIVDGLRRPRGPGGGAGGGRALHTSSVAERDHGGIDEVLRERAAYKEAGRGRVAPGGCAPPDSGPAGAGASLDLAVPPAATRVSVRVTLHSGPPPPPPPPSSPRHAPAPANKALCFPSNVESRDSWLSFKSIQQKLTNKRPESAGADGSGGRSRPPMCPARPPCPPPCPPPAPPPPPPPPKHPYPRHPCPSGPSCPPKTSQPCGGEVAAKYLPLTIV